MKLQLASFSLAALLAAGCGNSGKAAPRNTMPDAATHSARYFPIMPGDTHGPAGTNTVANCNGCHQDWTTGRPSASFRLYSCTVCHETPRPTMDHGNRDSVRAFHVAIPNVLYDPTVSAMNSLSNQALGLAPEDAACRSCHPSGIAVDHVRVFKLPHQDAAGTTVARCADCHLNPADRTQLGCASCHPHDLAVTTTGHALVPDFQATGSALCARCHEDGKIPVAVSAHAAGASGFAVGTGLHAGAAGGACLRCHDASKAAPRAFVADFTATNCVGCHDVLVGGNALHGDAASLAPLHTTVAGFNALWTGPQLSTACLGCHADGAGAAPANHEQLFPRAAGTRHAGIGCAQCHGTGLKTDLAALACAGCHTTLDPTIVSRHTNPGGVAVLDVHTSQSTLGPALTMTSPNCLRCHADSQVDLVASHTRADSGFGRAPHMAAGCVTCHTVARTDKPYPAINFGSATGCVTCHVNGVPN